jgi:hypothetical protein
MKASDAYLKWLLFFMLLSSIAEAQHPVFVIHAPDKYSTEERFEAWASPTMIDGATLASLFSGIRTGSARFILKKGPSLSGIAIGIQLQAGAPGMRIQLSDAGNGDVLETLNHIHLDKSKSFLTRFFDADSIMLEVLFNETRGCLCHFRAGYSEDLCPTRRYARAQQRRPLRNLPSLPRQCRLPGSRTLERSANRCMPHPDGT